MSRALIIVVALLGTIAPLRPAPVGAQAVSTKSPARASRVDRLREAVAVADNERVRLALLELSKESVAVRVQAVDALLASGVTDSVAAQLLAALGATHASAAVAPLANALLHRVPTVRVAALHGLRDLNHTPEVAQHVALGLRDADASVRGAAALALAAMGTAAASGQLDVLFTAFDRGVPEAAVAIGTLAPDASIAAFTGFVGTKPIAQMLAGYRELLTRNDISEASKLGIVATLEEVAGLTVKRFLQALRDSGALDPRSAVQRAVSATIARIPEAPSPNTSSQPVVPQGAPAPSSPAPNNETGTP